MSLLSFLVYPTGERYIRYILSCVYNSFRVIDIIRYRTTNPVIFAQRMFHIYREIDPSKLHKAEAKIAAQGKSSSFVVILVEGDEKNIEPIKKTTREHVGCNCIHSSDNTESTMKHLDWLFGKDEIFAFDATKEIQLDSVHDFLCRDFRVVGDKWRGCPGRSCRFFYINEIFELLESHEIKYAVVNMGPTVEDNVCKLNKDIEIVCSDRTRAVDILGAEFLQKGMLKPHEGTYLVQAYGAAKIRKVKLDFSLSVFIPGKWRDHVIATRIKGKEGFYIPLDVDRYWLTMFERTIYKPRKYGLGSPKYGKGAEWNDLVSWGINMGVHPQIKYKTSLEGCQEAVEKYIETI